jgi:DNA mismatch repair ATPase MutS
MADPADLPYLRDVQQLVRAPGATGADVLDDGTWSDLDLDAGFTALDTCRSVLGRLTLYHWLRAPIRTLAQWPKLRARVAAGQALETAPNGWSSLAELLGELPWLPPLLVRVLEGVDHLPTLGATPNLLAFAAWLAPAAFLSSSKAGGIALFVVFAVNMAFHFLSSRKVDTALGSLAFVNAVLGVAAQASRTSLPGLEATTTRLGELVRELSPLARAAAEVGVPTMFDDFPAEHLRIYALTRERRLTRCASLIETHAAQLREVCVLLGELDAAAALARFRRTHATSAPEFTDDGPLTVEAARHPTLKAAVPNDLTLSGGLVITGSNMSGKSTFLRMLALNALYAQALGCVCAKSWRGPLVQVGTSLRARDDLEHGQSTYSAEAVRLRTLLEGAASTPRALVLIDEPFRGTNSAERVAAGVAVLRHLRRQGALVVAATHDLEVSRLLADTYATGYFVDTVTDAGLHFDYRLHEGFAGPRNAVRLLGVLGYPQAVLDDAAQLLATGTASLERDEAPRSP